MNCPAGVKSEEKPGKSTADLSNPFLPYLALCLSEMYLQSYLDPLLITSQGGEEIILVGLFLS